MSTDRSRNIRRKESSWAQESEDKIEIKSRQPKKLPVLVPFASQNLELGLDKIQDRNFEEPFEPKVPLDDDEDLILKKRAEIARSKREEMRNMSGDKEFISLNEDEDEGRVVNTLEMIAETGVHEEVYEDLRGARVRFGVPKTNEGPDQGDLELTDEESHQWEMEQLQKGMSSAGLKSSKDAQIASKKLARDLKKSEEKTTLLDYSSLDFFQTELLLQINQLESSLNGYKDRLETLKASFETANDKSIDLADASEKAEYFRDLNEYIHNFSQFAIEAASLMNNPETNLDSIDNFFLDALPEYNNIDVILGRFKDWELKYPDEYAESFVQHQLPFLLEIFVLKQMKRYNPGTSDLSVSELMTQLHPDIILLQSISCVLLEKIYIPHILEKLAANFDPANFDQVNRVKRLLAEIEDLTEKDNKSVRTFKFYLSDLILEAKETCEPGSERLQSIIKCQSILEI